MDPYYEQRLRDEVIYLHSLWHQGPPPTTTSTSTSTSGRKRKVTQNHNPHHKAKNKLSKPDPPSNSDLQWPTPTPAKASAPGWPEPKPASGPSTRPASAEERARNSALILHHNASNAFRQFLAKSGSDSDDSDDDDSEEEEDNEGEKYQFFLRIFMEDSQLRRYYEENFEGGEFCCLVCGVLGKKNSGRRFKNCLGLVQHSVSLSKSESNDWHRALAQVICGVLGWDFNRLPVIVFKGEPLGRILAKEGGIQGEPEANAGCCEGVSGVGKENVVALNGNVGALGEKHGSGNNLQSDGGKLVNCEGNVGNEGAHKDTENVNKGFTEMGGNEKGALDEPGSNRPEVSTSEWPCAKPVEITPSAALEWPAFQPPSDLASAANWVSAEDQARLVAEQLQHDAVKACQNYFTRKYDSDSDENDNEDEEENASEDSEDPEEDASEDSEDTEKDADGEDDGEEDPSENSKDSDDKDKDASKDSKLFTFFLKLLMEDDGKLRDFYVNNCEAGDFCCLVCGGIGKKPWKRFSGCVALVQHSTAITNTKKKPAHRAYGQVVCRVLGWDINRFPSIVLKGEALGQPLEDSGNAQGELKEDADCLKDNSNLSFNSLDVLNGGNDETVLEKDSGVNQNETSIKHELTASSSSHVQSSVKSAELQQLTISFL
ncbi:hypothetical protein TorRG33x02_056860 [Trema orientale]|uniref:Uncharacterized protein n=1 Tax=Trema orientale TaxID=63057 RepID=A0A2P5FKX6_TREOI|nr:hypothetical protein TorRG33x02_056860 [Trema orientale]